MGCPTDSDCIALSVDHTGTLIPEWIIDPASGIYCGPDGLFDPKLLTRIGCVSIPDQLLAPPPGSSASVFSPVLTVTNPSPTRPMQLHISVLFGTPQFNVFSEGTVSVVDLIGVAAVGELSNPSFVVQNSCAVSGNATFPAGIDVAFNTQAAHTLLCPEPLVAPSGAVDIQIERRAGAEPPGFGDVLLRTSFIFLWSVIT